MHVCTDQRHLYLIVFYSFMILLRSYIHVKGTKYKFIQLQMHFILLVYTLVIPKQIYVLGMIMMMVFRSLLTGCKIV